MSNIGEMLALVDELASKNDEIRSVEKDVKDLAGKYETLLL